MDMVLVQRVNERDSKNMEIALDKGYMTPRSIQQLFLLNKYGNGYYSLFPN